MIFVLLVIFLIRRSSCVCELLIHSLRLHSDFEGREHGVVIRAKARSVRGSYEWFTGGYLENRRIDAIDEACSQMKHLKFPFLPTAPTLDT